ncbi:MAG: hypothetical protein FWH27_13325 [Planctomycetaceae bacterium]|nr:hypothetical protein [Planctomycetaceae bacterium]
MSEVPTNPMLKRILIAIAGVTILGAVLLYLLATYPAGEYRVADELRARKFGIYYDRQDYHIWKHLVAVGGRDRSITEDDCRLLCQLPHLQSLGFERCDFSESNEIRKLAACPIRFFAFVNASLNDSDLADFAKWTKLERLHIYGNAGITDAVFEYLEKIASLRDLCIAGTSVTQDGVREFQKKRPDVKVFFE